MMAWQGRFESIPRYHFGLIAREGPRDELTGGLERGSTIDAFSEINVIEDDLLLGFIYLVDYPIFPHCLSSNLPVTDEPES